MHLLYDQLQEERKSNYNNGLYYMYRDNIFSTINELCNIHLIPFQIYTFIEDDIIPTKLEALPIIEASPSKIPRKLIIISNKYTPHWILDHYHDELTIKYICNLHQQITFLPLRDVFRIYTWSGKILSPQKENELAKMFSHGYPTIIDWFKNIVPSFRKLRPFKHGNVLLLYMLFVRECLKHDIFPPALHKNHLSVNTDHTCFSDIEHILSESTSETADFRYI